MISTVVEIAVIRYFDSINNIQGRYMKVKRQSIVELVFEHCPNLWDLGRLIRVVVPQVVKVIICLGWFIL